MLEDLTLPDRYRLSDAGVPGALLQPEMARGAESVRVDIDVVDGRIVSLAPAGASPATLPVVALQGRQVWPCFVDVHTHLDKAHTWDRAPNPDGTFLGAIGAIARDRVHWTVDDVRRRMEFGLAASYAHGTRAI